VTKQMAWRFGPGSSALSSAIAIGLAGCVVVGSDGP
jgi:hypothetical protein